MSHFTRIKTKIVEKEHLLSALRDLHFTPEEGDVNIRGWNGRTMKAQVKIATKNAGYDIGFHQKDGAFDIVADWYGIKAVSRKTFVEELSQRYAYHAARCKLEAQGFTVSGEEIDEQGRIHLVLRRLA